MKAGIRMNISFFCKMRSETDHVKTILTEIFQRITAVFSLVK